MNANTIWIEFYQKKNSNKTRSKVVHKNVSQGCNLIILYIMRKDENVH